MVTDLLLEKVRLEEALDKKFFVEARQVEF
jgi:hypothetical protein